MSDPVTSNTAARREQRRKQVDDDDELSPLAKALVKTIQTQGDETIDTFKTGFGDMKRTMNIQTLAGMGMVFIVVLVVVFGLLQTKGVDIGATADAIKIVAPLATTTTSTAETTTATTEITTTIAPAAAAVPADTPAPMAPTE